MRLPYLLKLSPENTSMHIKTRLMHSCLLATSVLLAACSSPYEIPSDAHWNESVAYRIDDHRYISIRSPSGACQSDEGRIYYSDEKSRIHTVAGHNNVKTADYYYRGYYAVRSTPDIIAIPVFVTYDKSPTELAIRYSRDGGQTFDSFNAEYHNESDSNAVILDGTQLYVVRLGDDGKVVSARKFDLSKHISPWLVGQRENEEFIPASRASEIPMNLKSPSGQTRWNCFIAAGKSSATRTAATGE